MLTKSIDKFDTKCENEDKSDQIDKEDKMDKLMNVKDHSLEEEEENTKM